MLKLSVSSFRWSLSGGAMRVAAALAVACLPGCTIAHMPVPDELAPGTNMPVSGRQGWMPGHHLRFGPFEAREMDRPWVKGHERSGVTPSGYPTAAGQYRERYSFRLYDGEREVWRIQCRTDVQAEVVDLDAVQTEERVLSLECLFASADTTAPRWRLALDATGERPPTGQLAGEGRRFLVEGTLALQGTPFNYCDPSGYYVKDGLRTVAAIEVLNDGTVRLARGLPPAEQDAVAGAAAALLLFDDLRRMTDELAPEGPGGTDAHAMDAPLCRSHGIVPPGVDVSGHHRFAADGCPSRRDRPPPHRAKGARDGRAREGGAWGSSWEAKARHYCWAQRCR